MERKKIALINYRLNKGGSERVGAILSVFFHKRNIDVHNIIVIDDIGYPYAGTVLNLGKLKNKTNGIFNKIHRIVVLNKYLKKHKFDFIIDLRFRIKPLQELLIAKCVYNTKTIFTVHSSKLDSYIPNQSFLAKMIYGKCYKIVSITKGMQEMIEEKHGLKNVLTIYNPIDILEVQNKAKEEVDLDFEYVIGAGQYDTNVKQFDKLIEAYSNTILPENKINLVILGDGKKKQELMSLALEKGVSNFVHFLGFKDNPYKYIKRARFFVLSSSHEGMPMVLLESLACGTPIVSFNCKTGPNEIIEHRENGLLAKNQDIGSLIKNMNLFINDSKLYQHCKEQTQKSAERFSIDQIGEQWLKLMEIN